MIADKYAILLDKLDGKRLTDKQNSEFWFDRYGISLKTGMQILKDHHFLEITNDPKLALPTYRVPELKDMLRQLDLKISGNKKELIERLLKDADPIKLSQLISVQVYKCTSKGNEFLQKNNYLLSAVLDSNFYLPTNEIIKFHQDNPQLSDDEIMIEFLKKHLEKETQSNEGNAIYYLNQLIEAYKKQQKYVEAMKYELISLYLRLSGRARNLHLSDLIEIYGIESLNDNRFLPESWEIESLTNLIDASENTQDIIPEIINSASKKYPFSDPMFDADEISEIITDCINDNTDELEELIQNKISNHHQRYTENDINDDDTQKIDQFNSAKVTRASKNSGCLLLFCVLGVGIPFLISII